MQSATWRGFRHEQAVGAAATGDRSRSKREFMGNSESLRWEQSLNGEGSSELKKCLPLPGGEGRSGNHTFDDIITLSRRADSTRCQAGSTSAASPASIMKPILPNHITRTAR